MMYEAPSCMYVTAEYMIARNGDKVDQKRVECSELQHNILPEEGRLSNIVYNCDGNMKSKTNCCNRTV